MEQLDEKFEQLCATATICKVSASEVRDEIADSMDTANKHAKVLISQGSSEDKWWPMWWVTFLQEWSYKCFVRYLGKCGDLKDYEKVQNLWLSDFEPLWMV